MARTNGVRFLLGSMLLVLSLAAPVSGSDDVTHEAIALYREGKIDEARILLRERIAAAPQDVDAHLAYVQLRSVLGEREELRKEYDEILAADPTNSAAKLARISIMAKAMMKRKAFEELLEENPDFAAGWDTYGRSLLNSSRMSEAVGALERAVETGPDRTAAWVYLGIAYRRIEETEKEIAALRKAVEVDPHSQTARLELGTSLSYDGDPAEAVDILEGLRKETPDDAQLLVILGMAHHKLGHQSESEELARLAEKSDHRIKEQLLYIGMTSQTSKYINFSRRMMELAVFVDSAYVESYMQLGILFRTSGQPDEAIRVYETAIRHGELNQLAWRNLGMSYEDKNEFAKAEGYFRKSLEVDPDYLIGWVDLGRNLVRLGKNEDALEIWKKVLAMAPYGWEAKEARHNMYYLERGEEVPEIGGEGGGWTPLKKEDYIKEKK